MAIRNVTNARSLMEQARSISARSLDILKFPDDLEKVPHKMLINIRSYSRAGAGRLSIPTGTNTRSAIALPVPARIEESYSANYTGTDLGNVGNAIANAIDTTMNSDLTLANIGSTISTAGRSLAGVSEGSNRPIREGILNIGQALAYQLAIGATSTASGALGLGQSVPAPAVIAAGTGMIFNPHTTAIFGGVNLRTMSYNWTLAPKTERESRSIEQIVKTLRNAMLPSIARNELFLKFPDQIEYKILGALPDYDMPTTPCVITNINLNRTGAGPVFFAKTGAPTVYNLTIQLMEIRALTRNDFLSSSTPSNTPSNPTPTPATTQDFVDPASATGGTGGTA